MHAFKYMSMLYNSPLLRLPCHKRQSNLTKMDEALMAKEAEKADLLKRRQKLREQLVSKRGGGLAGAELDRVR